MLTNAADLQYFIEIAQTKNLSRAAERLGVSQPSLTLAMKRLEHSMGVDLLSRSKRGVNLTPAGNKLLSQARFLLQEWKNIQAAALASHTQVVGTYKVGCHPSVALYSLPQILPKLLHEYPELEIQLFHDLSRRITEQVISFQLDLGIVVNPTRHPDLIINELSTDEVALWRSPKCLNPKILICDLDLLQTQSILKGLKKSGLHFDRVMQSSSLEVISQLVASGVGYGILPSRVAAGKAGLVREKGSPFFTDTISLVYRVEGKRIRAIQEISNALKSAF